MGERRQRRADTLHRRARGQAAEPALDRRQGCGGREISGQGEDGVRRPVVVEKKARTSSSVAASMSSIQPMTGQR